MPVSYNTWMNWMSGGTYAPALADRCLVNFRAHVDKTRFSEKLFKRAGNAKRHAVVLQRFGHKVKHGIQCRLFRRVAFVVDLSPKILNLNPTVIPQIPVIGSVLQCHLRSTI